MKFEDIFIGQKVTPFQKTAGIRMDMDDYYRRREKNGKFLKENGFLYIVKIRELNEIVELSSNLERIVRCEFSIDDIIPFDVVKLKDLLLED